MNEAEAMERIEGDAFSGVVNLASDFRTFLRILVCQPEVQALEAAMKSAQVTLDVFTRALEVAASSPNDAYEHPADAALSAYLWLLGGKDRDYSEIAAEKVLRCERCWWVPRMAELVRETFRQTRISAAQEWHGRESCRI